MIHERAYVHETAVVDGSAQIGAGSKVWAFAQISAGAKIGENCTIGNGVYIDRGVVIGNNVMIHNRALLYRPLIIQDDVFIGPQVSNANDPSPASHVIRKVEDEDKGTLFMKGARIGMAAHIAPNITIGEYAFVEMCALVTKDVPSGARVRGLPAKVVEKKEAN